MDFSYREEQLEVRQLAQQILSDFASEERRKRLDAGGEHFDAALWHALGEAGLLGVAIDADHGGMGFDFETLCLLLEECGRTAAVIPAIPCLVSAALPLQRYGDPQQCEMLSGVAAGQRLLTAALVEPGNEDVLRPAVIAEPDGGGWRLSGSKHCVPYARQAEAALLAARCSDELLVFLVPLDMPGVELRDQHTTGREPQAEICLEGIAVGEAQLLARGRVAEELLLWSEQLTRAALSALATGLCDRMMRMTAEYTSSREQFGVPVATFQAVAHRAADCYIDVDCLRLVSQEAVSRLTLGIDATEAVLVAKIWTGDVCHRVSQAAQHLHGGIGVDRDYPLHRFCLLARQVELTAGSSARLTGELGSRIAAAFAVDSRPGA
jgi:alkylation response protein AidB-like acyl-CoA dehydrogenase